MTRLIVVTALIGLFVANLAGVVASFTAPSHSSKKRLKVRTKIWFV
jgi:Na+/serine symporter